MSTYQSETGPTDVESERIALLHALNLLDTNPEDVFDRVTRLLAKALQVPIALVSLVDTHRQWFKSCIGLPTKETPREYSFCAHAIKQSEVMIVANALQDDRFRDNPLVTGSPDIRFYAGVPLRTREGYALGTLCAIDTRPRYLSHAELQILQDLASIVMREIQLREVCLLSERQIVKSDRKLKSSEARFRAIFEHAGAGIALISSQGMWLEVNGSFCALVGYSHQELTRLSFWDITFPEDLRANLQLFSQLKTGEIKHYQLEKRYRHKEGKTVWVKVSVTKQTYPHNAEDFICVIQNIQARKEAEESLLALHQRLEQQIHERTSELEHANKALTVMMKRQEREAMEDSLTGLPNRRAMYRTLQARLNARPSLEFPLQIFCLDLDGFKLINDSLGHAAGDRVLMEIASRLSTFLQGSDFIARLGGDEFVLIVDGLASRPAIEKLCERLIESIGQNIPIAGHEVSVGCSIGMASAPRDSNRADEILRFADIALCEAKAAGRNSWQFYTEEMNTRLLIQRQIESDLKLALQRDELRLEFQPRYAIEGMHLVGAEALVRWQHPIRGYINPAQFISIAEETGLIVPLSDWILRQACLEAASWDNSVFVSVNLSAVEFKRNDLVERVKAVLQETGLSPQRLELEITEGVMLDNAEEALILMKGLKQLGVQLSMDDFGTGYSSLSYLHRYPLDGLKIDQSFIKALCESAEGRPIIEAIIGLGRALSLVITAEGVETPDQLYMLAQLGCKQAQGYYLARPMDVKQLNELMHVSKALAFEQA
ncbi:PAS domain S-box-containing protein/diguanylate cyclase (GGDEF)-like protein [Pseudomonas duriflava]|uniref:PAS domain S-box-containing protein/diguanylate cyclase (GGDEF)-like protein n=1 Tax=Pseudomonas duriflava TaxID=459528 RepID=A0A562PQZ6_9PSED|nr:EAL domain-containing protein [Pseudomonas duriflava]TWI46865.1 PAS domain S-box-containing protein/diguanylate cyclase (GGDEF)-like protein [Pseudomonas duriflava]